MNSPLNESLDRIHNQNRPRKVLSDVAFVIAGSHVCQETKIGIWASVIGHRNRTEMLSGVTEPGCHPALVQAVHTLQCMPGTQPVLYYTDAQELLTPIYKRKIPQMPDCSLQEHICWRMILKLGAEHRVRWLTNGAFPYPDLLHSDTPVAQAFLTNWAARKDPQTAQEKAGLIVERA